MLQNATSKSGRGGRHKLPLVAGLACAFDVSLRTYFGISTSNIKQPEVFIDAVTAQKQPSIRKENFLGRRITTQSSVINSALQ